MNRIAVVYHSKFGNTKQFAELIAQGAQEVADATVAVIDVTVIKESDWDLLQHADAILFGCPTYMGSVSGEFKMFMDATSPVWMSQGWKNKIAAGFTTSGSPSGDKLNVLVQLAVFAAQHSMIWVGTGLMPEGKLPEHANRLGSFMGAMAQTDGAEGISPGDAKTARHLGRRVAELAQKQRT